VKYWNLSLGTRGEKPAAILHERSFAVADYTSLKGDTSKKQEDDPAHMTTGWHEFSLLRVQVKPVPLSIQQMEGRER